MNKRGSFLQDHIGAIILLVIVVLIGVIIYIQFYYNSSEDYQELRSCNLMGLGNGICRDMQDTNCYELGDCPPETKYCCISLEEKERSIMPNVYGGNANYNFAVTYIGPNTPIENGKNKAPEGCTFDNTAQTSMECFENQVVNLPVKVFALNKGRAIITVKAIPYYIINDDPTKIFNGTGIVPLKLVTTKDMTGGEVNATVGIKSDYAVAGNYVRIYPYAFCDMRECKKEDSRGILRTTTDPEVYIIIKFISKPKP